MVKLTWSPGAIADIRNIAVFIAQDSPKAAENQVQQIFDKVLLLERYPFIGKPTPELADDHYREILCGRYRIIYKIHTAEELFILTVHHQSRLLVNNPTLKRQMKKRK